jgi:hypothetical protein
MRLSELIVNRERREGAAMAKTSTDLTAIAGNTKIDGRERESSRRLSVPAR